MFARMTEPEKTMTEPEIVTQKEPVHLDDKLIRLIGIPLFGTVIPHATGLIRGIAWADYRLWISHLYFILLSALIWQGNRFLLFRTRRRFTWFESPIEKLILLLINNIFYTAPVTVALLCAWYAWMGMSKPDWNVVQIITLVNIICVLFITHVYETVFMVKEQQNEQIRNARLEQAKSEAELTALKNQVDPHFMFNSLNTLTYLIRNDSKKAYAFTENLAEVYRYILSQKDRTLVLLEDELEFTHKYTDLLHLRFGNALVIKKSFTSDSEKQFLIPPTSVFVAFENAVKHNEITERHPLQIDVSVSGQYLVITNSLRERRTRNHSSKIGLKNLEERFRLITGTSITTEHTEHSFSVSMPMIELNGQKIS
jgi:hypothetical protein